MSRLCCASTKRPPAESALDLSAGVSDLLRAAEESTPRDRSRPDDFGDYQIVREIGRGGMGVVYEALQVSLSRTVALKVLPKTLLLSDREADRFKREAKTVARLDHRCVVKVFDSGEQPGFLYFAMEFVPGRNLKQAMERVLNTGVDAADDAGAGGDGLPPFESEGYCAAVCRRIADAAEAAGYAHGQRVVHRDIKPSNIILTADGGSKLVDFGLARDHRMGQITVSDDWGGTPSYMSPEQLRAKAMDVDERTDVYSLGVVLYEALTLRQPFTGASRHDVITQILDHRPIAPQSLNERIPRDLEVIVQKAMAERREDRYESAAALRDDLRRFLNHQAIHARPLPMREAVMRWFARHRIALAGLAAAVALVVVAVIVTDHRGKARRVLDAIAWAEQAAASDLSLLPMTEVAEIVGELRRVRQEHPGVAAPEFEALESGLDELRASLLGGAVRDFERVRSGELGISAREPMRMRAMESVARLQIAFPDDPELRELVASELALPQLLIEAVDATGAAAPATALLKEIDPLTSQITDERPLGPTPVDTTVPPGWYRVVVVFDDGGLREYPCHIGFDAAMRFTFRAERRVDEAAVTDGMVLFEATRFGWGSIEGQPFPQAGASTPLAGFYLDRCEVTNGQYRAFLAANPDIAPPPGWPEQWRSEFDDLPVSDVSWSEAAAYAAWAGKRLPTWAEWLHAATGENSRPVPWIQDGPDDVARGNVGGPRRAALAPADRWSEYAARVGPACAFPDAATPEDVRNMWGNVAEWTESPGFAMFDGGALADPASRIFVGGGWDAMANGEVLGDPAVPSIYGTGDHFRLSNLGFRCARSAEP